MAPVCAAPKRRRPLPRRPHPVWGQLFQDWSLCFCREQGGWGRGTGERGFVWLCLASTTSQAFLKSGGGRGSPRSHGCGSADLGLADLGLAIGWILRVCCFQYQLSCLSLFLGLVNNGGQRTQLLWACPGTDGGLR